MSPIPLYRNRTPTAPGIYLWAGATIKSPDLITVIRVPARSAYGLDWDAYLGVVEYGQRNVDRLNGYFSDPITVELVKAS